MNKESALEQMYRFTSEMLEREKEEGRRIRAELDRLDRIYEENKEVLDEKETS